MSTAVCRVPYYLCKRKERGGQFPRQCRIAEALHQDCMAAGVMPYGSADNTTNSILLCNGYGQNHFNFTIQYLNV